MVAAQDDPAAQGCNLGFSNVPAPQDTLQHTSENKGQYLMPPCAPKKRLSDEDLRRETKRNKPSQGRVGSELDAISAFHTFEDSIEAPQLQVSHPADRGHQLAARDASHTTHSTSHSELTRLSTRPYALRATDPSDFVSAWENSIVALLSDLIQKHYTGDFTVDVHNFPEVSSEAVPRVIYITLSTDDDTTALEQTIRAELVIIMPEQFSVHLKFQRGGMRRSTWRGKKDAGEEDAVCTPRNVTYKPTPVISMSIGYAQIPDAASLGGSVKVAVDLSSCYDKLDGMDDDDLVKRMREQVRQRRQRKPHYVFKPVHAFCCVCAEHKMVQKGLCEFCRHDTVECDDCQQLSMSLRTC